MEVGVLAGVAINVFERHVVLEERVPPGREMHAATQASSLSRANFRCNEAITRSIFAPIRWRL